MGQMQRRRMTLGICPVFLHESADAFLCLTHGDVETDNMESADEHKPTFVAKLLLQKLFAVHIFKKLENQPRLKVNQRSFTEGVFCFFTTCTSCP